MTHPCPGCRADVDDGRFGCVPCMRRLPDRIRGQVTREMKHRARRGEASMTATLRAVEWFSTHPR